MGHRRFKSHEDRDNTFWARLLRVGYRPKACARRVAALAAMKVNAGQPIVEVSRPLRYSPMILASCEISITRSRKSAAAIPLTTATITSSWIGLLVIRLSKIPPTVPNATRP